MSGKYTSSCTTSAPLMLLPNTSAHTAASVPWMGG